MHAPRTAYMRGLLIPRGHERSQNRQTTKKAFLRNPLVAKAIVKRQGAE